MYREPTNFLSPGSRGAVVSALQNALAGCTYGVGREPDGVFDGETEAALKRLQGAYGVVEDAGRLGSQTMKVFDSLLGVVACPTPGLIRITQQAEVTPSIAKAALRLLHLYWDHPIGSEFPFRVQGKRKRRPHKGSFDSARPRFFFFLVA